MVWRMAWSTLLLPVWGQKVGALGYRWHTVIFLAEANILEDGLEDTAFACVGTKDGCTLL
jgi:hypothetical protein